MDPAHGFRIARIDQVGPSADHVDEAHFEFGEGGPDDLEAPAHLDGGIGIARAIRPHGRGARYQHPSPTRSARLNPMTDSHGDPELTLSTCPMLPRMPLDSPRALSRIAIDLGTQAKSALIGLTNGLARDLGERGITVNVVHPGSTDTEMNPADGKDAEEERGFIALGHYGTTEDITVAHLAGEGGRYITGTTIAVDGGYAA